MPFPITVLVSTGLGLLSGLGIGGGSLMILWLTLVCGMDYPAARYLNLLFFLPPAFISVVIRMVKKQVSIKKILPAALAGSLSAVFFSRLSSSWDVALLRRLFGGLLLLTAWKELRYRKS